MIEVNVEWLEARMIYLKSVRRNAIQCVKKHMTLLLNIKYNKKMLSNVGALSDLSRLVERIFSFTL